MARELSRSELRESWDRTESKELSIKINRHPEMVIAFLRSHNFGFPEEPASMAVRLIKENIQSKFFLNQRITNGFVKQQYSLFDSLIYTLEQAGYAAPQEIPNNAWSEKAERALNLALKDWNKKNKKWKDKKSKGHESWKS